MCLGRAGGVPCGHVVEVPRWPSAHGPARFREAEIALTPRVHGAALHPEAGGDLYRSHRIALA